MHTPPTFSSLKDFIARAVDAGFWQPYLVDILTRHDLTDPRVEPVAGVGGTYPTFICGDVAVKLFGYLTMWRESHKAECAAQAVLATDLDIAAPRLVAQGCLYDDADMPWPYLISTRMSGVAWGIADLSWEEKLAVAADLGRQIHRIHTLPSAPVATHQRWLTDKVTAGVVAAARQSSLPPHLIAQIDDYLAESLRLPMQAPAPAHHNSRCFVHGDLMFRHVFVADGRLTGIIDWGDAMVTDRHYELAALQLNLFNCNKDLLRVFLEAGDWPVTRDFARKAMCGALYRQAYGLAQHYSMDVFYTLPALLPLQDMASLDELAAELFGLQENFTRE